MEVVQVIPTKDYKVYIYFADGKIKLFDARPLVGKGVFAALADPDFFLKRATVLNNTLAWDKSGYYDPTQCLDLDPDTLYAQSVDVEDPCAKIA